MNLDKAIELLSHSVYGGTTTFNQAFKEATKLGIEALKEVERLRSYKALHVVKLLPGETEE